MTLSRQINLFLHPIRIQFVTNLFFQRVLSRSYRSLSKSTILVQEKEILQDNRFMKESELTSIQLCNKLNFSSYSDILEEKKLSHVQEIKRSNLIDVYKLPLNISSKLVKSEGLCEAFESIASCIDNKSLIYTFLLNNVQHRLNAGKLSLKTCGISTMQITEIIELLDSKKISMESADDILEMFLNGDQRSAKEIVEHYNWFYLYEGIELEELCKKVLKMHGNEAKKYKRCQKKARKRYYMTTLLTTLNEFVNRASLTHSEEVLKKLIQNHEKNHLKLK